MANATFIGGRPVVVYRVSIGFGGTYAQGDTVDVTIDGLTLQLIVGTDASLATIAANLVRAWEGEEDDFDAGYSATFLGTESARHYQLQAVDPGAGIMYLTERELDGVLEGRTFPSLSVDKTSTSGTITLGTPTDPTGPYDFEAADNFAAGTAAADGDEVVFEGPYACKYNIDQSGTITDGTFRVKRSFSQLGLPRLASVTLPSGVVEQFHEYRDQYFKTAAEGTTTWVIGEGAGEGPNLVKIHPASHANTAANIRVIDTGSPLIDTDPAVFIVGGGGSGTELRVFGGTVGVAIYEDDPSTNIAGRIWVTQHAGQTASPAVVIGKSYNGAAPAVYCNAGTVTVYCTLASGGILHAYDSGVINYRGGEPASGCEMSAIGGRINIDTGAGTISTMNITKGSPGFLGSVYLSGGFTADQLVITNCKIWSAGCALISDGTHALSFTNDIKIPAGLDPADVIVQIPQSYAAYSITREAIS